MRHAHRAPAVPVEKGETDKALEERNLLWRRYRAARKAHRETLYIKHPCGGDLQTFAAQLKRYTQLSDATAMLTYVRAAARSWLTIAPPEIKAEALSLINEHIIRIRTNAGLPPFDDPLPGEPDKVFQQCKQELA